MAQIQTNPWSFVAADQAASVAITSIVRNGTASALVTTSGVHSLVLNQWISVQGTTIVGWRNGYEVLEVPSTTTFLVAIVGSQSLLANNGANGNVLTVAYPYKIRGEQIAWQNPTASTQLSLTDTNGNPVWTQNSGATDANYTYGKPFWFDGLVINALPNGTLLITVN